MKLISLIFCLLLAAAGFGSAADESARTAFISKMVDIHRFDRDELERLLRSAEIKQNILDAMSSPAEALPWHQYRKIFLTDSRIEGGVEFWENNLEALKAAEEKYGVPPEIIVAIIGVETRYGAHTGSYR
ncbi:MAG: lytic murein transglycosylase, partial [Gammaproteobacteria bacterium]